MSDILLHYHRVNPTTWFYFASLLSIALFFKFNRLLSIRNLDLLGLILLAPGLLAVESGAYKANVADQQLGFFWIFTVSAALLARMLCDSMMVRRPMLEPNLTTGGLVFLGAALLVFLLANVITTRPQRDDVAGAAGATRLEARDAEVDADQLARLGPGYPLLFLLPQISTQRIFFAPDGSEEKADVGDASRRAVHETTARVMAIVSQLAIVAGMVLVGWRHFENARLGIAAAVLYLLLPYTATMTGRVDHVLPGALMIWAIAAYRRPFVAGVLVGLAIGTIYYPVFLLPLWCSFYWERGVRRFALGVTAALATLAIWPAPKNLGTLLSCTAAVLLGSQFWKAHNGGLFMAWWLPVLLLVVFRPNLENRVAILTISPEWFPRRRAA